MSIRKNDILFYAGGKCFEKFGVPVMGFTRSQQIAPTFTRSGTVATVVDRDGRVRLATADRLRPIWLDLDGDGVRDTIALLVEPTRTNAISAAIASWSITNSGTWTGTTTGPDGVADSGKGIAHGSGGAQFRANNIPTGTPTDNTVQAVSVFAKAADVGWCFIRVNRKNAATVWVYYNLATGVVGTDDPGITGYIDGPYLNGFYRCMATCDILSGGSTAQWEIGPADGDGDATMAGAGAPYVYFFAPCWEMDAVRPSSPLLTPGAVRGAETLFVPHVHVPQESSWYGKILSRGGVASQSTLLYLGASGSTDPRLMIDANGTAYRGIHDPATLSISTLGSAPGMFQSAEFLLNLAANGTPLISQSLAGGAPTSGTGQTAQALGPQWSDRRLYIGSEGGTGNNTIDAIVALLGVRGTRTLDECREVFA